MLIGSYFASFSPQFRPLLPITLYDTLGMCRVSNEDGCDINGEASMTLMHLDERRIIESSSITTAITAAVISAWIS